MSVLCVLLMIACGYDYRKRRIPNLLVAFMLLWGVGLQLCRNGPVGIFGFLVRAVCVMGVLYPLFKIGAVGAGDVKLFGVTAGFLPFQKVFLFLFMSLLIAAIISLYKLMKMKNLRECLGYFCNYLRGVQRIGRWQLYLPKPAERCRRSICLSGPVLLSVLLCLGGVY